MVAGGHAHVAGEVHHRGRLDLVQMVEDARLMPAEQPAGLRIADVAGVAGEVDAGIQGHHRGHGFADGMPFSFALAKQYIFP